MDGQGSLVDDVQDALKHLYTPDYEPGECLYAVTNCDLRDGPVPVLSAVVQAIHGMEPSPDAPLDSREALLYDVLYHRYVLRLTQDETAEALNISVRHLNRVQREAAHLLASRLWNRSQQPAVPGEAVPSGAGAWHRQVRREIAALTRDGNDVVAELDRAITAALRVAGALADERGVSLQRGPVQADLLVRVHPSALRQVLLAVARDLLKHMSSGTILWETKCVREQAVITAVAEPVPTGQSVDVTLAEALLSLHGGSVTVVHVDTQLCVTMTVPAVFGIPRKRIVVAIDDNTDLVTLYQSYCIGTGYDIVHVREGQLALQAIEEHTPDAIILDVMLPDVDGWDLLMDLHNNPATKRIPIIVCSVITDEQLALALGATLYLPKPVWRQQLIDALDEALNRPAA
jgi:CheY-like chemotaxis protein